MSRGRYCARPAWPAIAAGADQEAAEAVRRVDPDHVPEDRPAADLDERLRDGMRALLQARPPAAAEDRDLGKGIHAGDY